MRTQVPSSKKAAAAAAAPFHGHRLLIDLFHMLAKASEQTGSLARLTQIARFARVRRVIIELLTAVFVADVDFPGAHESTSTDLACRSSAQLIGGLREQIVFIGKSLCRPVGPAPGERATGKR